MQRARDCGVMQGHQENKFMMKVKDLVDRLSKLDPNLDIYGYTEDLKLASDDRPYHVFSIGSMDV